MTRPSPEVLKCLPVLQVEIFDVLHRILPCRLPGSTGWENKPRTIASSKKLGGREEDLVPQCLQCGALKFVGQTQPTEPVEQIVGKQEQMEIGLVGEEMPGGDVAHHVLPFELFDEQLDARPIVVQAAEVEGVPGEIREQDLIVIPSLRRVNLLSARTITNRIPAGLSQHMQRASRVCPSQYGHRLRAIRRARSFCSGLRSTTEDDGKAAHA